jgi:hypothetical protein
MNKEIHKEEIDQKDIQPIPCPYCVGHCISWDHEKIAISSCEIHKHTIRPDDEKDPI